MKYLSLILLLIVLYHFNCPLVYGTEYDNDIHSSLQNKKFAEPLTLQNVIDVAIANYPSIREAKAKIAKSKTEIQLQKRSYLPQASLFWQSTNGTYNKINGPFFPQYGLTSVAGPEKFTGASTVWYTAGGGIVSWEPFDFGLRRANIDVAKADENDAESALQLSQFDVLANAANAYFNLLAAQHVKAVAEVDVARTKTLKIYVDTLVNNGLRPGADESKIDAELAGYEISLTKAEEQVQEKQIALATAIGRAGNVINVTEGNLQQLPIVTKNTELDLAMHPVLRKQKAVINIIEAKENAIHKELFPKFDLVAAISDRGSGINADGEKLGATTGLLPQAINYSFGFMVSYSITNMASVHDQQKIEVAKASAEKAKYEELKQDIIAKRLAAENELNTALSILKQTPIQLNAAKTADLQIRSRYKAGLANIVDVADSQRILSQAEIEEQLAHLRVWSAMLNGAIADGNIQNFTQLLQKQPAELNSKEP